MNMVIDGVNVKVENGEISEEEARAYVERGKKLYGKGLHKITAVVDSNDPEFISLDYHWHNKPFHRLRRITGYLVGTLERWNNGKRAEENDRVKHGTEGGR